MTSSTLESIKNMCFGEPKRVEQLSTDHMKKCMFRVLYIQAFHYKLKQLLHIYMYDVINKWEI